MALAVIACCGLCSTSAAGQTALAVQQTHYELRAGETVPIVAPQATLDFLAHSKSRHVAVVTNGTNVTGDAAVTGGLVVAPNRAGDQILLGASLRMKPGEYTVTLSASNAPSVTSATAASNAAGAASATNAAGGASASAAGESQTTLTVVVKPRQSVPTGSTRPPVVLLNGWEEGFTGTCPVATSSSDDFGNLASYLVSDGVPVVYLFDNCLEDAGQLVETLGIDLATFLNSITYDNGEQVPQIDLVAFSLGGLIARSYLAGLQPDESLLPPTTTLVRDLVLIATPNFGSFVAGNYAIELTDTQSGELVPASSLLWNLATWNQRSDDLRGVNAIAVIGNAGLYTPNLSATTSLTNASDGLVSLTSGSLGFVGQDAEVTRVVPYCHVDPSVFTNTIFGTFECDAAGIANVTSTAQETGEIVRSFLSGTTAWQSIGTTPATDPYLSIDGAMYFAMVNGTDAYVTDMTSVAFGTVPLVNGGDTDTIYYVDFVAGTGALSAQSTSIGAVNCGTLAEPLEFTSALRCKLGLLIIDVGPLTGTGGKTVNAGGSITISGSGFGSQCTDCKVIATLAGATTGQQLTTTAWSNTSITANLPASFTGLVTIEVVAVDGVDSIAVMANPQASLSVSAPTLQFAYTIPGSAPATQSFQITNTGSGTLSWSATANQTWISLSASSGTAPSTLSVSISPAGLSAGTYTGSIQIAATGAANAPASVGVTLVVTQAAPSLVLGSSTLTFQFTNGGAVPGAQGVTISNAGGGTLAWTASSNAYWLGISASSGSAPATLSVSVNPANLAAGSYPGIVTVTAPGAIGSPAQISVNLVVTGTQAAPTLAGLGSAATFLPPIASATWVAIVGTNLSQTTYTWQGTDFVNGLLPTSLEGVSVSINGIPAYVEYISPTQINVLAPDDTTVGSVQVQVTVAGQTSNSLSTQKAQFTPAFFTFGDGYVAAQHLNYTPVGAPNLLPGVVTTPAQPGETIVLYATGFGPTNPPLPTAQLVTTPEPLASSVQVSIGGVNVPVGFSGLVGPGLYQFNVIVPNLPAGDALVMATIGGISTQSGVSITIQ
jgi:uncharacterized protein (TIGR03437 family)